MHRAIRISKKPLGIFTYFFLMVGSLFFLTNSIFIGDEESKNKREKIHINTESFSIETHIEINKKKIKIDEHLTYFWYKARKINSTKGGYSGSLLDGGYDKFNKDKKLIQQGNFKRGLKHGVWKSWHENGELKSSCNYRKGLKRGKEVT